MKHIEAPKKHVPKKLQHALGDIAETCPGNQMTVDFSNPAICRVVVTVPLEKPLTRNELNEIEHAVAHLVLSYGSQVNTPL